MTLASRDTPAATWRSVLTLNSDRTVRAGSADALNAAIRRGADLRILTEFRHNEHIDTASDSNELIREVCDFQIVHHVEERWVGGVMGLRQPVTLPSTFGPRPSMSFFLYNQDGEQGIARPYLDGGASDNIFGAAAAPPHPDMPRYHQHDNWDAGTSAPCHNFVYDFEQFDYLVRDEWTEVLSHAADSSVLAGSIEDLSAAFRRGCQIKVAIRGLCHGFRPDPAGLPSADALDHEVQIQAGSCYDYTERKLFIAGTNPLVRIHPTIPLRYVSRGWDFGWCLARTDGHLVYRQVAPHTLKFEDQNMHCPMRWFVR